MVIDDLMKKSQSELDDLLRIAKAGPIPEGNAAGAAIVWPGSFWTHLIACWVHDLAWQGKVFTRNPDGAGATLENKVTTAGIHAIVARVYYTESWLDGKE